MGYESDLAACLAFYRSVRVAGGLVRKVSRRMNSHCRIGWSPKSNNLVSRL